MMFERQRMASTRFAVKARSVKLSSVICMRGSKYLTVAFLVTMTRHDSVEKISADTDWVVFWFCKLLSRNLKIRSSWFLRRKEALVRKHFRSFKF